MKQVILFSLGSDKNLFALDIMDVTRVISLENEKISPMYSSIPHLKGTVKQPEGSIPVIDLKELLYNKSVSDEKCMILTHINDDFYALLVEDAYELIEVSNNELHSVSINNVETDEVRIIEKDGKQITLLSLAYLLSDKKKHFNALDI